MSIISLLKQKEVSPTSRRNRVQKIQSMKMIRCTVAGFERWRSPHAGPQRDLYELRWSLLIVLQPGN